MSDCFSQPIASRKASQMESQPSLCIFSNSRPRQQQCCSRQLKVLAYKASRLNDAAPKLPLQHDQRMHQCSIVLEPGSARLPIHGSLACSEKQTGTQVQVCCCDQAVHWST